MFLKKIYLLTIILIGCFLVITKTINAQCNLITQQPVDDYTFANSIAHFEVQATGTNLVYTWEKLTALTPTWTPIPNSNTNSLIFLSVNLADDGTQYRCLVSDATCTETSNTATLFVSQPDTMQTSLSMPDTSCYHPDTFQVPVFISSGGFNNDIGAISMKITIQDHFRFLGDSLTPANLIIYGIDSLLNAHGSFLTNVSHNVAAATSTLSISWYKNANSNPTILFPGRNAFFFYVTPDTIAQTYETYVKFDNTYPQNNEYGDATTGYALMDDGFAYQTLIYVDTTICGQKITGKIDYGNFINNHVFGNSVFVNLLNDDNTLVNIPNNPQTVTSTGFNFEQVPAGQYKVALEEFVPNVQGAINSTDALRVMLNFLNLFTLSPLELQAAETDGLTPFGIPNANDAYQIARFFIGEINAFDNLGSVVTDFPFWIQDSTNVIVSNFDINAEINTILRGDVNASFDVSTLNGDKVSEITLETNETITINETSQLIEIPFRVTAPLEVGAVSMVIYFPYDILKIDSIRLNEKVTNGELLYKIENGRIRMSWFSVMPLQLENGEPLFTIFAKSLDEINSTWQPTITRGNDSELANAIGEVIEEVTLTMPALQLDLPNVEYGSFQCRVFPNPTQNNTTLQIQTDKAGELTIQMFNSIGMLVKTFPKQNIQKGETSLELEVEGLPIGLYSLHSLFKNENELLQKTEQLIISK